MRHVHSDGNPLFIHPDQERFLTLFRNAVYGCPARQGYGAMYALEVRDPTADVRLLEFCLGIPDVLQAKGGGRMVIRRAAAGILPDEVRWNTVRGNQAADLPLRLCHSPWEVDGQLDILANHSRVKDYLDMSFHRDLWKKIQDHPYHPGAIPHSNILLRLLMVGMLIASMK
jgi:asparagine synthase (glutamine-hydrolysing)